MARLSCLATSAWGIEANYFLIPGFSRTWEITAILYSHLDLTITDNTTALRTLSCKNYFGNLTAFTVISAYTYVRITTVDVLLYTYVATKKCMHMLYTLVWNVLEHVCSVFGTN